MKPKDAPITFPLSALGILAGFLSGICLISGGGYYEKYLLLTTRTPEELIGEFNRRDLDTLRRLKGWQLLALHHACDARMPRFDPRGVGKDLVSVPWYAAREQALRQLYPQAAYFDCSNEALFRAVFDQA